MNEAARIAALEAEVATYKHAFESTAADRDKIAAELKSIAHPLDAGYFRFDFSRFMAMNVAQSDEAILQSWDELGAAGKSGDMMRSLLASNSIAMAFPASDEYCRPFATYLLACLHATTRNYKRAMEYAEQIEFDAPPDATDMLPYDLRQSSRLCSFWQNAAIAKRMPSVPVVSLMKSASSFSSQSISTALDIPILKMSIGQGSRSVVCRKWAAQIARGGATTHEHFPAIPENIAALKEAGLAKLWVQVRDPRDAAVSLLSMHGEFRNAIGARGELHGSKKIELYIFTVELFAVWIDGWIKAKQDSGLNIEFVSYNEIAKSFPALFYRMTGVPLSQGVAAPSNFRTGKGGEWRTTFNAKTNDAAWSSIPTEVIDLLQLDRA